MLTKMQSWFYKKAKNKNERGEATFILWFMMMPILIAFTGLAIDTSIAAYTRTSIQSALDDATQSAISSSRNPPTGTTPQLSAAQAKTVIYRVYDLNRKQSGKIPFLLCQGSQVSYASGQTHVVPTSGCGFSQKKFTYSTSGGKNTVSITVTEYSSNIFLHMIGVPHQAYTVTSTARLTKQTE